MNGKVLIINTGGTICMSPGADGYLPDKARFRRCLDEMPELRAAEMPGIDVVDLDPLIDSSDMGVNEWNRLGGVIAGNYDGYDGFVVLHGTDTMAYTASALSFMLENLSKPVIVTGSQIPICELRSDGKENLITALLIAAGKRVSEVAVCFGGELLRGNRATKYSADGFIAFKSPNYPPLATIGITIDYNDAALLPPGGEPFGFLPLKSVPIGVIKVFPGIDFGLFEPFLSGDVKGVIIETFGAGNIPRGASSLLPAIQKAFEKGTVVTVLTQCLQGTVHLGAYEAGAVLKKAGVADGKNMTTEAAVAKLYYLMSKYNDAQTVRTLMERGLRGEE